MEDNWGQSAAGRDAVKQRTWAIPLFAAQLDSFMGVFMARLHSVPGGNQLLEWSPCDHYTEELQKPRLSVYKVCGCRKNVDQCKEQKPSCGCHHPYVTLVTRKFNICSTFLSLLQKVEIFSKLLRGLLFVLDDEQERLTQRKAPQVVSQQQADVVYFDIGGAPFSYNPVFTFIGLVQGTGMCLIIWSE